MEELLERIIKLGEGKQWLWDSQTIDSNSTAPHPLPTLLFHFKYLLIGQLYPWCLNHGNWKFGSHILILSNAEVRTFPSAPIKKKKEQLWKPSLSDILILRSIRSIGHIGQLAALIHLKHKIWTYVAPPSSQIRLDLVREPYFKMAIRTEIGSQILNIFSFIQDSLILSLFSLSSENLNFPS